MKFIVTIDDLDRAECSDEPWIATLMNSEDNDGLAMGVGATVAEALRSLLVDIAFAAERGSMDGIADAYDIDKIMEILA